MRYVYYGETSSGVTKKGTVQARSERDAIVQLVAKGISVKRLNLKEQTWLHAEIHLFQKVPSAEWVLFLRQFATLVQANISIVESLHILANQTRNKPLRDATVQTEAAVRSGIGLSDAMKNHPQVFPPMAVHLIGAGERVGQMDETLNRLALYVEKQHHLKQKVKSAMVYPALLFVFAVCVISFLLTNVVPTFASMFRGLDAELPAITRMVLQASHFLQSYWWLLGLGVGGIGLSFRWLLRTSERAKFLRDSIALRTPVFGKLMQRTILVRMMRTWSSLLTSKVPILSSIRIVEQVMMNKVMERVLVEAYASLEGGDSLCEPFQNHRVFPQMVVQMMRIGEQTDTLDAMFAKLADFYEQEVEQMTDRLKAMVEPLLIVFLSVAIGIIVLSIIVPMFDMFNHIQ
jgi:type IV pilus assembly protein PilC